MVNAAEVTAEIVKVKETERAATQRGDDVPFFPTL
jgi:hypothetical protein